ncbi:hypothetical protein CFBP8129_39040 [Xanthomonas hortorum pv. gardneri]|uniref:Uncharacterized protein n=1 Tax=Xanthomonas hortorum pv. gardneri TaxID=2754056 RepID=A0A6V7ES64_9XANT|nr:hypothetical protein CFBP8129_39040 [Xanthomonas hortorum pv. gardneri]CAD0353947.1 hypothetical protein CFBP8129_39040 [Xanthomonas hortorum pv. gardneri]
MCGARIGAADIGDFSYTSGLLLNTRHGSWGEL